jgi:hypothetical protein
MSIVQQCYVAPRASQTSGDRAGVQVVHDGGAMRYPDFGKTFKSVCRVLAQKG